MELDGDLLLLEVLAAQEEGVGKVALGAQEILQLLLPLKAIMVVAALLLEILEEVVVGALAAPLLMELQLPVVMEDWLKALQSQEFL